MHTLRLPQHSCPSSLNFVSNRNTAYSAASLSMIARRLVDSTWASMFCGHKDPQCTA